MVQRVLIGRLKRQRPFTGSQVSAGNRYIAYFNKCDNVIQLMSYTPAAPTPAA